MPTPIEVSPPLKQPGGGVVFVVTERVSLEHDQIVEDPPNIESDMVPPEC